MHTIKNKRLVFIDTETGGVDPLVNSLLSVSFIIWDSGKILDKVEIFIDDGELNVTPEALIINGINLEEHKKKAFSIYATIKIMNTFFGDYFEEGERIKFVGHNVSFDIAFLKHFLTKRGGMSISEYFKRFSHRHIDTSSIMTYLYLNGKIEIEIDGSDNAFKYFGIEVEGRHTAEGDNIATTKLFEKLIEIGQ